MDHRAASIQFLRSTGLPPVRVRPNQKDAYPDFDPRLIAQQDHKGLLARLANGSIDNIGALFAGRYIDLDVDTKDPIVIASLDHFLPRTQFVWGRASKPASHRSYMLHQDFDRTLHGSLLRYLKAEHDLEIRGGRQENGLYSVLPGSVHPSGEVYEWDSEIDPSVSVTVVPLHLLIRSIRLAIASALIARHWHAGSRNDLALAVSGLLWRIRQSSFVSLGVEGEEEVPDERFLLTHSGALSLYEAVMDLAGDDSEDRRSRLITFGNTWNKLNANPSAKMTGGKVLASLVGDEGTKLVKDLYRLLSDNPDIEQMEKLTEQFCMWYGPGLLIDLAMVEKGRSTPWMTKEQAANSLAGTHVTFGDKKVPAVKLLFSTQSIRRVAGLTCDPSTLEQLVETPEGMMINQWRGFACQPWPQRVADLEVRPFLDYIREVIADGSRAAYDWVLAWMADLLQRPHEKPGTALVLVGVQGAGKSFLGDKVLQAIIGRAHSGQTNSISQLTDKFNSIISNKIFLQCDEAVHSYQKDIASKLKSVITDASLTIEPKNVNSFRVPNNIHLLFTSNEEFTAIYIDASPFERRFTVLKVAEIYANNVAYWVTMHRWVAENLPKVMRYLLDYTYDRDLIRRPLETEAKLTLQKMGLEPEISWILDRMQSGSLLGERAHTHWFDQVVTENVPDSVKENDTLMRSEWPTLVNISALQSDFKDYVRSHGKVVHSGSVLTTIRRVFPVGRFVSAKHASVSYRDPHTFQVAQGQVHWYLVPTKAEIKAHLQTKYGAVVDEVEEPEVEVEAPMEYEDPEF